MLTRYATVLLLLLGTALLFTGCQKDKDPAPVANLEKVLQAQPEHSAFYAALRKTDLLPVLSKSTFMSVLAPTDAAFAELAGTPFTTAASIAALQDADQIEQLRRIVKYHLLPDQALNATAEFEHKKYTTTLPATGAASNTLYVWHFSGKAVINGYYTAWGDMQGQHAVGGVVHTINHVLLPPTETLAGQVRQRAARGSSAGYTLFWEALQRPAAAPVLALLQDPQRDYTLLLPSDAGLLRTLQRINPAWTSLAAVPDAALLRLLQVHCIPARWPSFLLFKDDHIATLAGSDWNSTLDFQGGFSLFDTRPYPSDCQVTTSNTAGMLPPAQTPHLLQLDIPATNGTLYVLDEAVQP